MAVSKLDAEAAVTALRALTFPMLTQLLQKNEHLYDRKHLTKASALVGAAGGGKVGYFKREVQESPLRTVDAFKKLTNARQRKVMADLQFTLSSGGGVPKNRHNAVKKYQFEYNAALGYGQELFRLIHSALEQVGICYQSSDGPDTRFIFVTAMPDGYVGRYVRAGDTHGVKDATFAFVVITVGANPQVITAYPSNDASVAALTALV